MIPWHQIFWGAPPPPLGRLFCGPTFSKILDEKNVQSRNMSSVTRRRRAFSDLRNFVLGTFSRDVCWFLISHKSYRYTSLGCGLWPLVLLLGVSQLTSVFTCFPHSQDKIGNVAGTWTISSGVRRRIWFSFLCVLEILIKTNDDHWLQPHFRFADQFTAVVS